MEYKGQPYHFSDWLSACPPVNLFLDGSQLIVNRNRTLPDHLVVLVDGAVDLVDNVMADGNLAGVHLLQVLDTFLGVFLV